MNRSSDLKRFVSVIIILAAIMAMTGCATSTTLSGAAYKGQTDVVKDLLDKGANVNERGDCDWLNAALPALSCAALNGHTATVKLLLDRGADVNARTDDFVWTPLVSAAFEGHAGTAKLLVERGADIDAAMDFLRTYPGKQGGVNLLERLEKQQLSRQSETLVSRAVQDVSTSIKSDIDELPTIKVKPNKNAYAVVIGIEQYRQKLPKADFATQDARLVANYLTKVMGYPEENIVTLSNEHATKSDFEKYFERWLPNNVEAGSSVFVYYSGHGAPNPKTADAYLVPYDGDPSFIAETGYSLNRMYAALGKLPAKEIVVALDSCFSGAGGRSVIAKGSRPLVMNLQSNVVLPKNMTVLSASAGDQTSSTYDEKGHGLFTYFMLKGIKNEDVIKPDGSIRMDDLFGYIKPQVERIARKQYNNQQTPQLMGTKKD